VLSMTDADDRPPADPTESIRLITEQRAEAARRLEPDPRLLYWPWGVAWLVGFALLFLRFGPDGRTLVGMPPWLPLTTLLALLVAAAAVTGVAGARASAHVSGESATKGAMYGLTWPVAFAGMAVTLSRVADGLGEADEGLLWAASAVGLTAALHMAGGAVWTDRDLFTLGTVTALVNIAGVLAGPGWHSLVVALAGGGGLLVTGAVGHRRRTLRSDHA
jgi:hypothetical protein